VLYTLILLKIEIPLNPLTKKDLEKILVFFASLFLKIPASCSPLLKGG